MHACIARTTRECNAVQGAIQGEVMVLDAWLQRGATCIKQAWSLAECCRLCRTTPKCTAFTYCNARDGCGSGCSRGQHEFKFNISLNTWALDPLDHAKRLNPEHKCTAQGAWPFGQCSLKMAAASASKASPALVPGSECRA